MGTRADFYVGRGPKAEWLGSIAFDGYPDGITNDVLSAESEEAFRTAVQKFFDDGRDDVTLPEHGWPWPWDNSNTTDWAYAFDGGVWMTCFGYGWQKGQWQESDESQAQLPDSEWPNMAERRNMPEIGGKRSGLMVFSVPRKS